MQTDADPVLQLEHDHVHLSHLVGDLRGAVARLGESGADGHELREEFVSVLHTLVDDLFDHFAREEQALFPFLAEEVPELRNVVTQLEQAHDRICGAASRILALCGKGSDVVLEQLPLIETLFARLDAEYVGHARFETDFFRGLSPRLDARQRATLAELLRAL